MTTTFITPSMVRCLFFILIIVISACSKTFTKKEELQLPRCFVQIKNEPEMQAELEQCLTAKPCFMWKDIGPRNGRARYCQSFSVEKPSIAIPKLSEEQPCRIEASANLLTSSASYSVIGKRFNHQQVPVSDMTLKTVSVSEGGFTELGKKTFVRDTCYAIIGLGLSMYEKDGQGL